MGIRRYRSASVGDSSVWIDNGNKIDMNDMNDMNDF